MLPRSRPAPPGIFAAAPRSLRRQSRETDATRRLAPDDRLRRNGAAAGQARAGTGDTVKFAAYASRHRRHLNHRAGPHYLHELAQPRDETQPPQTLTCTE